MKLSDDIRFVKGIGEARAKLFARLGIVTVEDLLLHLPRSFEDRSQTVEISNLTDGDTVCVRGSLAEGVKSYRARNRIAVTRTAVSDGSGIMRVTWFNSPYISAALAENAELTFYGKTVWRGGYFEMVNPVIEAETGRKTGRIVPVYPSTAGLAQNLIRSAIECALKNTAEDFEEVLSPSVRKRYGILPMREALEKIHLPSCAEDFETGRRSLAFEELFVMQTGIQTLGEERRSFSAVPISDVRCIAGFAKTLPFELTAAQKRVINEICSDIKRPVPMNRLVQGDVGSGKTMVAAAAIFAAVRSGFQAAFMAPTELLAKQHYRNLTGLFEPFGIETVFLSGGMSAAARRESMMKIESGAAKVIVGTHALISDGVKYDSLALAVTDEQHRFGVRQRARLTGKGVNVHTLVMTATPIPRSLSLVLYGDLDISVIDELPPGRKRIETYGISPKMRSRAYEFIRKNIAEGRQAYIVCPLIEESEALSAKSAVEYAEKLKGGAFSGLSVEVMHGRLKGTVRDEIMERFIAGEIDVLVSTTVIEVGVDVPNATVMMIENAERFGLAQLHQLRGRIGRGAFSSFCILVSEGGKIAKERVETMCKTCDGFKISEKDLELRGPGEFFGVRQHGLPELHAANLATDTELLQTTRDAAKELLDTDPRLEKSENASLKRRVKARFAEVGESGILN